MTVLRCFELLVATFFGITSVADARPVMSKQDFRNF